MASSDPRVAAREERAKERATIKEAVLADIEERRNAAIAAGESFYPGNYDATYPGFRIFDVETGQQIAAATGSTPDAALERIATVVECLQKQAAAEEQAQEAVVEDVAKGNAEALKLALAAMNGGKKAATKKTETVVESVVSSEKEGQ